MLNLNHLLVFVLFFILNSAREIKIFYKDCNGFDPTTYLSQRTRPSNHHRVFVSKDTSFQLRPSTQEYVLLTTSLSYLGPAQRVGCVLPRVSVPDHHLGAQGRDRQAQGENQQ